jgi:hypothetical protein
MSEENEADGFWLEEYKIVTLTFHKYLELYLKSFVIFTVVVGAVVKFALDDNATEPLRTAMGWIGIAVCCQLGVAICAAEILIGKLKRRRNNAVKMLRVKDVPDTFSAGHWASITFGVFAIIVVLGMIFGIMRG